MSRIRKTMVYSRASYHYFRNRLLTNKSIKEGKMYVGPWTAYLIITNKCNCNCIQCPPEIAIQGDKEKISDNLTVEDYYNLIDQLVESGCQRIGLTGGEPLIFMEKTLRLLEKINERAYSQFVTNGSLIDSDFLNSYNKLGGGHITISVDGLSESHNRIRGKTGLFEKLERVFYLFSINRYRNIMLKSTFTLFNNNVEDLVPVANYFIRRKIPLFIGPYENYKRKHSLIENRKDPLWIQKDKESILKDALKEIIKLKKKFPHLIINGITHLVAIEYYFLRPEETFILPKRCYYGYRTAHITPIGEIATCMGIVGSLKNNKFFDVWDSQKFHNIRRCQQECTKNCMLGCVIDHSFLDLFKVVLYQIFKK